ncbi:MAG: hypothetical protein U0441_17770 [Polyangiaceae bacterium]
MRARSRKSLKIALFSAGLSLALAACGGSGSGSGGGGASTTSTGGTTATTGGAGGSTSCADVLCSGPGEICTDGACVVDCRKSGSIPCGAGTVCDASDAAPGQCVPAGSACLTTSEPEPCGDRVCGPGSACDGQGKCYPRVPCQDVACDAAGCWGTYCACTRVIGCSPAPVGSPGDVGTLHDDAFRKGLVDLEFDPACSAWGVTLISGPDYLRSISPTGVVDSYSGVTNLNMGEVSVLQNVVIPKSGSVDGLGPKPPPAEDLDVALTYICCAACGCQLSSTPQGVSNFDPSTNTLPLVIPSQTFTDGTGPFGAGVIDTGPAGLTYGTDRVLYVGNVDTNGDYYRLDLATNEKTKVTTFASRVYASTPFDAANNLVALEGGEIRLLRLADATSTLWATSDKPVTGMIRDFFDGAVYVARADAGIWKYDGSGQGASQWTAQGKARLTIAPDGYLYALDLPASIADGTPTIERWELPTTR